MSDQRSEKPRQSYGQIGQWSSYCYSFQEVTVGIDLGLCLLLYS